MKNSLRAAVALGALALATAASASTVNLSSGSVVQAFDPSPTSWMTINVGGGVTGAKFNLADTINDGYTVNYQLFQSDMTTAVGSAWSFTDIGNEAANLAQTAVYRALGSGTYMLQIAFANPDAKSHGVTTQVSAVPLPAAAWLFGSAVLGFGALRRKQNKAA